ncbi:MAG TPA: hypothetical protein PLF40_31210, partial [Kofleriaceae bacterium]|nr:hypothetical protein [Kofleriaceae bacterium]
MSRHVASKASLITRASAVLDRTAARFIGDRMGRSTHRDGAAIRDLRNAGTRLRELAAAYGEGTAACPGLFFPAPARPSVAETVVSKGALEAGVIVSDLAFASEYVPFLPAARTWYPRYLANNTVHARSWRKPVAAGAAPRPVMILIHGWGAGEYWMIEQPFETSYWLHHGFDVCAFVLPFHGARTPDLTGELAARPRQGFAALSKLAQSPLFPSPNIARTNEAFGQAIYDL